MLVVIDIFAILTYALCPKKKGSMARTRDEEKGGYLIDRI
jgi:type II secretory pathway pseudopilin PulG